VKPVIKCNIQSVGEDGGSEFNLPPVLIFKCLLLTLNQNITSYQQV
jgi:hypothetical protein